MNFSNLQIDIDQLPKTTTLEFESLEKSFEWYSVLSTFIWVLIIEVGLITSIYFIAEESHEYLLIMIIVAVFVMFLLSMIAKLSYKYEGYAIRQLDVTYKSGIFYRAITTLPFNRIQHMEISQGPVEKLFKLYTLSIFTAGGSGSDVQIHGLSMDKANNIKAYISERSIMKVDEEE